MKTVEPANSSTVLCLLFYKHRSTQLENIGSRFDMQTHDGNGRK